MSESMWKSREGILTEQDLEDVFQNANYGDRSMREVVRSGLLKCVCGYASGHTTSIILNELGLINGNLCKNEAKLTKIGKEYLWADLEEELKGGCIR